MKLVLNFLIITLFTGCSVTTPSVKSLLSRFNSFRLDSPVYRIDELSDLSTISVTASCDSNNSSFEYEMPEVAPGVWNPIPTTASGIFTTIDIQCASTRRLTLMLDLDSMGPFSTMTLGQTFHINFRDINLLGISHTENFGINYSAFKLTDNQLNNGQGLNSTVIGTTHTLQGRITNQQRLPTVNGTTHTLQGKIVFE